MMDRSHLNQKDMKNCKLFASLFMKGVQNVHHLQGHAWRCFLHWSTAVSIMSGQKSDHGPTLLNCKDVSLIRTVNGQKTMLIFCTLLIFAPTLWHLTDTCWID